jgi:hypothetical protein
MNCTALAVYSGPLFLTIILWDVTIAASEHIISRPLMTKPHKIRGKGKEQHKLESKGGKQLDIKSLADYSAYLICIYPRHTT